MPGQPVERSSRRGRRRARDDRSACDPSYCRAAPAAFGAMPGLQEAGGRVGADGGERDALRAAHPCRGDLSEDLPGPVLRTPAGCLLRSLHDPTPREGGRPPYGISRHRPRRHMPDRFGTIRQCWQDHRISHSPFRVPRHRSGANARRARDGIPDRVGLSTQLAAGARAAGKHRVDVSLAALGETISDRRAVAQGTAPSVGSRRRRRLGSRPAFAGVFSFGFRHAKGCGARLGFRSTISLAT